VRSDALQASAAARVVDRLFDLSANFADAMIAGDRIALRQPSESPVKKPD
jgi:hypothetical protein